MPNLPYDANFVTASMHVNTRGASIGSSFRIPQLGSQEFLVQIAEIRSPFDYRNRSQNSFIDANSKEPLLPKSYLYGKKSSLYTFDIMLQKRLFLGLQNSATEIDVSLTYAIGAGFGLVKPYYMQLLKQVEVGPDQSYFELEEVAYSEAVADRFTNPQYIYGRSNLFKGFSESTITPYLAGNIGISARFGKQLIWYKEIFTGIQTNLFSEKLTINIVDRPKQLIYNFQIGVRLGKKW